MSNSTQNETHNVCNERLAKEGGQARCCDCEPHDGCTLGMKPTQNDWRMRFWEYYDGRKEKDGYINPSFLLLFIAKELADARKEVIVKTTEELDRMIQLEIDEFKATDYREGITDGYKYAKDVLATLKED